MNQVVPVLGHQVTAAHSGLVNSGILHNVLKRANPVRSGQKWEKYRFLVVFFTPLLHVCSIYQHRLLLVLVPIANKMELHLHLSSPLSLSLTSLCLAALEVPARRGPGRLAVMLARDCSGWNLCGQ